jgi:hypothetical protein
MKKSDFRDATPCNLVVSYEHFGRTWCLHRQGRGWRQQVTTRCHIPKTKLLPMQPANRRVSLLLRSRQDKDVSLPSHDSLGLWAPPPRLHPYLRRFVRQLFYSRCNMPQGESRYHDNALPFPLSLHPASSQINFSSHHNHPPIQTTSAAEEVSYPT